MGNLEYRIQMKDAALGKFGTGIISSGGCVHVSTQASPDKATLFDKNGVALANPITPTRGFINFFIADTITAGVDLYCQSPGGQFKVVKAVQPSGPNEIIFDTTKSEQLYQIPFSIADSGAAVEKFTGFVLPNPACILDRLHGAGIYVTTLETTGAKTIDVGTSEAAVGGGTGGDANGLIAASSTAAAGLILGTNGALFSTNAPATSLALVANLNLTYTLVTASVTAKGIILLPVRLNAAL